MTFSPLAVNTASITSITLVASKCKWIRLQGAHGPEHSKKRRRLLHGPKAKYPNKGLRYPNKGFSMKGNAATLGRKKERAILALLAQRNVEEAARAAV